MSAYVDTSVLGAYYCPEPLSKAAEDALRHIKDPCISVLTEVEFHSLVAKKQRLKELSERQARELLDLFGGHVADGFYRRIALTTEHYFKARYLIGSFDSVLHTLDALHLAVALAESLPLFTADNRLAVAAKRHKSKVTLVK